MLILDQLLKISTRGFKSIDFSQMSRMLDILEITAISVSTNIVELMDKLSIPTESMQLMNITNLAVRNSYFY